VVEAALPPQVILLFVWVLAVFTLCGIRMHSYFVSLREIRERVATEVVVFHAPVSVKIRVPPGIWSTKTLGGLEIYVGHSHIWVVTKPAFIGAAFASEWLFDAGQCEIRQDNGPRDPLRRPWIVIAGRSGSRDVQIAISPRTAFETRGQPFRAVGRDE
jgi:hypothetical protein